MDKPEHLFDIRVVERNIAAGVITREDYEAWLEGLEDCADRAEEIEARPIRHVDDAEADAG
ncbi:MAG: hypothetical protein D6798_05375 [Deltaproteobacteria bacterium]|nr:MAG: hypothetical protein D6798_05375 [Deltaproteobacteria bacterium]